MLKTKILKIVRVNQSLERTIKLNTIHSKVKLLITVSLLEILIETRVVYKKKSPKE